MDGVVIPRGKGGARPGDRLLESGAIEWLQQVVERMDFERAERVMIERGDERDLRHRGAQRPHDFEPVGLRHLNVEKHKVGMRRANGIDRRTPVAGFANHDHIPASPASSLRMRRLATGSSSTINV